MGRHQPYERRGLLRIYQIRAAEFSRNFHKPFFRRASQQGIAISADQMQPGDLIFYGSGRSINHVAMYIGNGQIVHASTERTGITVSNWNYRNPVKIVNVLG